MKAKSLYWKECIENAAEECGLTLTPEQLTWLSEAVESGEENLSLAFYTPPPSDRIAEMRREWEEKLARLRKDYERYQKNAETAIKIALHQCPDTHVRIGRDGEVLRFGGRIERLQ